MKGKPAFPKGVQIDVLVGDPTKIGDVFVMRIKFSANFPKPPHIRPYSEVVTVISGDIRSSPGRPTLPGPSQGKRDAVDQLNLDSL
jgi:hypothetical protein